MVRAGGIGHDEGLLERRECGAELLRHSGECSTSGDPLVDGVSTLAGAVGAAGGAGDDALGAAGVLVGLEDKAPLGGPLCHPTHVSILIIPGEARMGSNCRREEEWGGGRPI